MLVEPSTGAVILHGETPGQPGYRRKCRCSVCRAGHAEHNRAWRAAKKQRDTDEAFTGAEPLVSAPPLPDLQSLPTIDYDAPAGTLEAAFDLDLQQPDDKVAFARTLVGAARYNARVLDQVPLHGRMDLISSMELRLFEVLNRISLLGFAGFSDGGTDDHDEQGTEGAGVAAEAAKILAEIADLTQPGVPVAPVDE